MLEFDFDEMLNEVDYKYIRQRVKGFTQVEMENVFQLCEKQVKNEKQYLPYEIEEAKAYIEEIEERMMKISTNELVAI